MCCFFTSLMLFGPRLAIIVWYLYRPVYVNLAFGSFFGALIGFIFLPWSTLMYLAVYPGGIFGFEWLLIGLGIFADMAGYFGGYKNKSRVPYGDQIP